VSEEQDSWTKTICRDRHNTAHIQSEMQRQYTRTQWVHALKQETRERGKSSSVKQTGIGMSTGIVSSISKQQKTENSSNSNKISKTAVAHEPPEQKHTKNKKMPLHPYTSSYSNTLTFSCRYTLIPLPPYNLAAGHNTRKWNSQQDNA